MNAPKKLPTTALLGLLAGAALSSYPYPQKALSIERTTTKAASNTQKNNPSESKKGNQAHLKPLNWRISTDQPLNQSIQWRIVEAGTELPSPSDNHHQARSQHKGDNTSLSPKLDNQNLPQFPTFGGFRDLYRQGRWHPSISTIIPMGYGPKGLFLGLGFSGADCKPEAKTCIKNPNISIQSIESIGEAVLDTYIGLGDTSKAIGITVSNFSQGAWRASAGNGDKKIFGGNQTGLAVSRNLWSGSAIKIGAEGWFRENALQADLPKSAYGVLSQRILLKPETNTHPIYGPTRWFGDLYLTAGIGNGYFRPIDNVISAQIQSAKDSGCWSSPCSDSQLRQAYLKGTEWGNFYPIGAATLAITDQTHLITEWTGRNLNISISWQPIRELGWTITPGLGQLIQNSDYGKNVNIPACPECDLGGAITTRPIFYLRSMINIKF